MPGKDDIERKAEETRAATNSGTDSGTQKKDVKTETPGRARAVNQYEQPKIVAKDIREAAANLKKNCDDLVDQYISNGRIGAVFSNEKQRKLKGDLAGDNGAKAEQEAQNNLSEKLRAFHAAKGQKGSSSWIDVCDALFAVIQAYLELRVAQGKDPDSFLGRIKAISALPLNAIADIITYLPDTAEACCEFLDGLCQENNLKNQAGNKTALPEDAGTTKDSGKASSNLSQGGSTEADAAKKEQNETDPAPDVNSRPGPGR